jgi:formate hydrogenlyase subunit 6/NADH:ubiquinone oxidoreductase subunit I
MKKREKMPWFIPEMCVGCGDCAAACGLHLIELVQVTEKKNYIPRIRKAEECAGCGMCAKKCSYGALMMTSYVEDAMERLKNS